MIYERVERSQFQPGDHLYVGGEMQSSGDFGIFIGDDKIIHYVNPKKGSWGLRTRWCAPFMRQKTRCRTSYCGEEKVAGSRVRMSCVDCFIKEPRLYRITYEPDPPNEVIERATYLYENWCSKHKRMNLNTNLFFATYCKTGLYDTEPRTVCAALHQLFYNADAEGIKGN